MSIKLKKYVIGVISSLLVASIIGAAGWMTSLYQRVYSLDCNSARTNEILLKMAEGNEKMVTEIRSIAQDVKTNSTFVIRHEERNNEQDRRLADHQRQIEIIRNDQGG